MREWLDEISVSPRRGWRPTASRAHADKSDERWRRKCCQTYVKAARQFREYW